MKQRIETLDEFINENKIIKENEEFKEIPHFLQSNIKEIIGIKNVFNWFYYDAGWPKPGFIHSELKNPKDLFNNAIKDGKAYLRNGKTNGAIVKFVTTFNIYMSRGDRYEDQKERYYNKNLDFFNTKGFSNETFKEMLEKCINVIATYKSPKFLKEINLAAYLQDVTSYSSYMSGDFKTAWPLVIQGLRKNKIKITHDDVLKFGRDIDNVEKDELHNVSGFVQIDSSQYDKAITLDYKGTIYLLATYSAGSAYGRY